MKKKWKLVSKEAPPVDVQVWGYDTMYDDVHICSWDGEDRDDYGRPFPRAIDVQGDNYSLLYWMEKEQPPSPPNVDVDWIGRQCLQCQSYVLKTGECTHWEKVVKEEGSCSEFMK